MNKGIIIFLLSLVLISGVTVLLPAQENETPGNTAPKIDPKTKELLTQALNNLTSVKGFHFEIEMKAEISRTNETEPFQMDGLTTGIYQQSGLIYVKTKALGREMEIYQQGDHVVSRDVPQGEWVRSATNNLPSPNDIMKLVLDNLSYAKLGNKETIQEHKCQGVEIGLTQPGLDKLIEIQMPEMKTTGNAAAISDLRAFIGEDDGTLYKLGYVMNLTSKTDEEEKESSKEETPFAPSGAMVIKISLQMSLFDYNKDIDFQIPDKVKKLLEKTEPPEKKSGNEEKGKDEDNKK